MRPSAYSSNSIRYLTEVIRIQKPKMLNSKKGFVQLLALPFAFPMVSLGIGIFLLVLLLMLWFMLGKILGAVIVIFGLLSLTRFKWPVAVGIMLIGLVVFFNPFGWVKLQMIW